MSEDEKGIQLDQCKTLLECAKDEILRIYEFKDLVSYIDIALDEVRNLERGNHAYD